MPLPTESDFTDYYGAWPVISIENVEADRLGIITADLYVTRQDPIDFTNASLGAAPVGYIDVIPCVGVTLHKMKGLHTWIYKFDGKIDYQTPAQDFTYELEGADRNVPIENHPDFLALIKKYGGTYNTDGSFAGFPSTMPGDATTKNPLYGMTDYDSVGWVWVYSYTSAVLPEEVYENAGCIEEPNWGGQEPMDLGQRQALKLAPRCTWRGNVWSISERWRIGGREGINKDVYRQVA